VPPEARRSPACVGIVRRVIERWPVVGRTDELAHAEALLAKGTGVVVVGTEGVGKTTFARVVAQRAAARGTPTTLVVARVGSAQVPMEAFAAALGEDEQPPTALDTMPTGARRPRRRGDGPARGRRRAPASVGAGADRSSRGTAVPGL
jgi:hypothetical protein